MKKIKTQTAKVLLAVTFAFLFILSPGFSAAQEQEDVKSVISSPPVAETSGENAGELVEKCLAVPAEMRLKFSMEYYDYEDYKMQSALNGVANCQAYTENNQEQCDTFNLVVDPAGMTDPGRRADLCKKNTEIFNASLKASKSRKSCTAEMNKYCEVNDLCSKMTDWGAIKCQCEILSELLCEIAGAETTGQCGGIEKNVVLKKSFPKLYFPAMISECQAVIKGQTTMFIGKGETRLIDLVFLTSLFKGNKWNLFEKTIDQESLNLDESFMWYWKYIHYAQRPCGYKLDSVWKIFCGNYPQIRIVKKIIEDKFKKNDFSGSASPNSEK